MGVNRGKQFEDVVKENFQRVPGLTIDRIHDQTNGFKGSSNICDFIAFLTPCRSRVFKFINDSCLDLHLLSIKYSVDDSSRV